MAGFLVSVADVLSGVSTQKDGRTPEELVQHDWLVEAYPQCVAGWRQPGKERAEKWIQELIKVGCLVKVVPGYYRTSYTSPTIGEVRQLREKAGVKE